MENYYDLLVIDDLDSWREIIIQISHELHYRCDSATNYNEALEKIHARNYKAIFMNWNFGTKHNGNRILIMIKERYPNIPVALVSGYFRGSLSNLQEKYPNMRDTIVKYREEDENQEKDNFIEDLYKTIPKLIQLSNNTLTKGDKIMILEQLTTTTIGAAIPFLFDRLKKLADRLDKAQLAKIEAKKKELEAMPKKTEQDIAAVQQSVTELKSIPHDDITKEIDMFVSHIERIRKSPDQLIGVGEMLVNMLGGKRENEENSETKRKISVMETELHNDIQEFNEKLELGERGTDERKKLYQRIGFALDMIKKLFRHTGN